MNSPGQIEFLSFILYKKWSKSISKFIPLKKNTYTLWRRTPTLYKQ